MNTKSTSVVDFYLDKIQQESSAIKLVLNTYFSKKDFQSPHILDICCGCVNEEPALMDYFGNKTELTSIDCDSQFEKIAKALERKSFRLGNIFNLEELVNDKFDLIIGRNVPLNPNYRYTEEEYEDPWPKFFYELPKYANSSSKIFLTLCMDHEFYRATEILQSNNYKILVQEENKIIVPSDKLGVAGADVKDNYIILANFPEHKTYQIKK